MLDGKAPPPYLPEMSTLTVTAKGQVTLKKEVLQHLGIGPGDRIEVDLLPGGRATVQAAREKRGIEAFIGSLKRHDGRTATLEDIEQAIADGWAGIREDNG